MPTPSSSRPRPSRSHCRPPTGSPIGCGIWIGSDRIDQRSGALDGVYHRSDTVTGSGVLVYVVDTGIDKTQTSAGFDVSGKVVDLYTADTNTPPDCGDHNGHGTHVVATGGGATYGVALGPTLVNVNIFGKASTSSQYQLIVAIKAIIDDLVSRASSNNNAFPPAVVNISVTSPMLNAFLDYAIDALASDTGVTIVLAAGNTDVASAVTTQAGGDACKVALATSPHTLVVGSIDINTVTTASAFSNMGPCVGLFAPGSQVWSARAAGAFMSVDSSYPTHLRMSGASMAAAHASGAAALLLQGQTFLSGASVSRKLQLAAYPSVTNNTPSATGLGYTATDYTSLLINVQRLLMRAFKVTYGTTSPVATSQAPVTAPGTLTFHVALTSAPTDTVVVSLALSPTTATDSGFALTATSLTFTPTNWSTPQPVPVTVSGSVGGPDAFVQIDMSAASNDGTFDGAVMALTIADQRDPQGNTLAYPIVLDGTNLTADGTLFVDLSARNSLWSASALMGNRALFTCPAVTQGNAAVYPNGPDVFVAFKLNKGCGASGNDPCAMRFSTCANQTNYDTTLEVYAFDAVYRQVTAPATSCSDDWTTDPGCQLNGSASAACLSRVSDMGCYTNSTDTTTYRNLKSYVSGNFTSGSWYVIQVGSWSRPLAANSASMWKQDAATDNTVSLMGTLGLTIKIDNYAGGATAMVWDGVLPPAQQPPPTPAGQRATPAGVTVWVATVLVQASSTTITAGHVATLKQAVSDLAQVPLSAVTVDLQFRRYARHARSMTAATAAATNDAVTGTVTDTGVTDTVVTGIATDTTTDTVSPPLPHLPTNPTIAHAPPPLTDNHPTHPTRSLTQSPSGTRIAIRTAAGSQSEGAAVGARVIAAVSSGQLSDRMVAMGAGIGSIALVSPTATVESALGPEPIYVDVPQEVPVTVVKEVHIKDHTVVSLYAALLIVLSCFIGVGFGLLGYRLYTKSRGLSAEDVEKLYQDKETRALLAGQGQSHEMGVSRSGSGARGAGMSMRSMRLRPHTADDVPGNHPSSHGVEGVEIRAGASQRSLRGKSARSMLGGNSQRAMETAALLAKAHSQRQEMRLRSQLNLKVARELRGRSSLRTTDAGTLALMQGTAFGSIKSAQPVDATNDNPAAIHTATSDPAATATAPAPPIAAESGSSDLLELIHQAEMEVEEAEEKRRRMLGLGPSQRAIDSHHAPSLYAVGHMSHMSGNEVSPWISGVEAPEGAVAGGMKPGGEVARGARLPALRGRGAGDATSGGGGGAEVGVDAIQRRFNATRTLAPGDFVHDAAMQAEELPMGVVGGGGGGSGGMPRPPLTAFATPPKPLMGATSELGLSAVQAAALEAASLPRAPSNGADFVYRSAPAPSAGSNPARTTSRAVMAPSADIGNVGDNDSNPSNRVGNAGGAFGSVQPTPEWGAGKTTGGDGNSNNDPNNNNTSNNKDIGDGNRDDYSAVRGASTAQLGALPSQSPSSPQQAMSGGVRFGGPGGGGGAAPRAAGAPGRVLFARNLRADPSDARMETPRGSLDMESDEEGSVAGSVASASTPKGVPRPQRRARAKSGLSRSTKDKEGAKSGKKKGK